MIVSIPSECLQEIFEHLQDDEISLHSILLVNRFWCKNVLPILWRQPFYLCAKRGASPKLVETYIQCMDNESKCQLKRECKILRRKISSRIQPNFDYARYLRRIATNDLWESVRKWVNNKESKTSPTLNPSNTKENTNTNIYSSSNKLSSSSTFHDHLMSPDQKMIICVVKELSLLFNKQCSAFDQLTFNTDHDEVIGFYLLRCLPQIREFNYSGWGNKERNLDVATRSSNCQNLRKLIIEKVSTESKRGVYGLKYGGIGRLEPITTYFPIPNPIRTQRHTGLRGSVARTNAMINDLILSSPYVRHNTYNITENIDIGTTNLLDPFYEIFTSTYTTETQMSKNLSSSRNDPPRSEREHLENLIKSQKKLQYISISFCDLNLNFINSLESQSRSLTYLEFDTITFERNVDLKLFGIFVNLKTLILTNCSWDNNIISNKQNSNNIKSNYDNLLLQPSSTTSTNNDQGDFKQKNCCSYTNSTDSYSSYNKSDDPYSTSSLFFLSLQTLSVRASSISQDSLLFLIRSSSYTLRSLTLNCQHDIDFNLLTFIITYCHHISELEFYIEVHDLIRAIVENNKFDTKGTEEIDFS
ncbi:1162_t:CDS:2 [Funneliformis mosseae]|uniref:1162_t:CDS:1 n=1 Tax=Funneliformis mosseae TaxID=27381 RepID=A0A9N9BVC1_FUNMO|nr:1162_t:CDS:2 [Funneliformis mosseae]